jgi:hypothetical protein
MKIYQLINSSQCLHALVIEANKVSQSSPNQSRRNDLTNQWGPKFYPQILSQKIIECRFAVGGADGSHIQILRAQVRLFGVSIFELSTIGGHIVTCSFSKDWKALQVDTHSSMNECTPYIHPTKCIWISYYKCSHACSELI